MKVVFDQVFVLIAFFVAGWFLCSKKIINNEHTSALSACVVYFFLPCTMLRTFAANFTVDYISTKYPIIIVGTIVIIFIFLFSSALSKILTKDTYQQSVFEYLLVCPSYTYIGYELCRSLYGDLALLDLIIFTIPLSVLYTYSIGYCKILNKPVSCKYLLNPTIISIIAGSIIGITGAHLPDAATILIDRAASCTGPIGLLAAGAAMARYPVSKMLTDKVSYILVAFRLVLIPLAVIAVLTLLNMDFYVKSALLMYAMPTGTNTVVFPRLIGKECESSAASFLISHILCLFTIPLLVYLIL